MWRNLCVLILLLSGLAGAQPDPGEADFARANQLSKEHKYKEALPLYLNLLERFPDDASILWNTGITAQYCEDWATALKAWNTMGTVEPANWKVRAKKIQVYQGMGDLAQRDLERKALLAYRTANPKSVEESRYCREQFSLNGNYVLAYENFDFSGERPVRYTFVVADASTGKQKYTISLGSYELDTQMAREMKTIKPDQRLYHLDYYGEREHRTYEMVVDEPSYETTRKWVAEILTNQKKPNSSSHS